jgi:hypothetical protein
MSLDPSCLALGQLAPGWLYSALLLGWRRKALSARETSELLDGDWLTSGCPRVFHWGCRGGHWAVWTSFPFFLDLCGFGGRLSLERAPHPLARTFHSRPTGVALWSSLLWSSLSSSTGLLTGSLCLNTRPQVAGQSRAPEAPA